MDSSHDYLSQDAILPAAGWLMATWVGIRSLSAPNVQFARKLEFLLYAVAAALLTVWWDQNLRSSRETTRNVQTLLALAGVSSKDGVNQGLDRLITRKPSTAADHTNPGRRTR
jgi:hypothetical protein